MKKTILILFAASALAFAQPKSSGLQPATTADVFDFSTAGVTRTIKAGTAPPATCTAGKDLFWDTDGAAGSRLLRCSATDTWTGLDEDGGGGSTSNSRVTFRIGNRDSEAAANRMEWAATANVTVGTIGTTPIIQSAMLLPDAEDNTLARTFILPSNWTNTTFNAKLYWYASVAGTNAARLTFETGCVGSGEDPVAPSFNTASAVTSASTGNALLTIATFSSVATTNCAAGELMWLRIGRVGADGADTLTVSTALYNLELEFSTSGT